jgi:hypothetical protein
MAVHSPLNAFSFDIPLIEIGQEIKLLEHFKKSLDHPVLYRVCQKSRIRSWNLEVFTFEYPLRLLVLFYLNSLRHSELSNVRIRTYHN